MRTHRSLCSGVKLGSTLSRSSIKMKSFPSPSYLANSTESPSLAERAVEEVDDLRAVLERGEMVVQADAMEAVVARNKERVDLMMVASGKRLQEQRRFVDLPMPMQSRLSVARET